MNRSKDLTKQRRNWDSRVIPINCIIENIGPSKGLKEELDQHKADFEKSLEGQELLFRVSRKQQARKRLGGGGGTRRRQRLYDAPAASPSL